MPDGWTGGQYSLFRALLGGWLVLDCVLALAPAGPLALALAALGLACGMALIAGWHDRPAAILALLVQIVALGGSWLPLEASRILVVWLLLGHALQPPAPYGSLGAVGRPDPGGGFRMDAGVYGGTWILISLWYGYTGWSMLVYPGWLEGGALDEYVYYRAARFHPVASGPPAGVDSILGWVTRAVFVAHLLFAPAALLRRVRPWLWLVFTVLHGLALLALGSVGFSTRMLLVHALLFDPAWVRGLGGREVETLFYDGTCGLCHRTVRFVLAEDAAARFRFAPLAGETFRKSVPESRREALPDSLVVQRADGALLARSAALVHVAGRLGGIWRILGALARIVPRALRDAAYDGIAVMRHRLFARPEAVCPPVSRTLRQRFLD